MTDYKDYQPANAPPWKGTPLAQAWEQCFGLIKDAIAYSMKAAVKAHFPQYAPPDALDLVGNTLQIDRAFAPDDATFVAQMMSAWATWQKAGTVPGMTTLLTQAGLSNVVIREQWNWSDGNPQYYFTVTCTQPIPWNSDPLADGEWSSAGTWGDGGVWASGIPVTMRARLKALITKFKPAHAICQAVIVQLTGRVWGMGSGTWGDGGTWGGGATLYINMTV